MSDNNLRVSFDYIYPDEPALLVCEELRGRGDIRVIQAYIGEKALQLYSQLTGKSIDAIRRAAGYTKYDYPTERMSDNG